nr:SDR family oxidoreductase [Candidatus Freyarchaeota archaeon]
MSGAASGIGQEIARTFFREGANIVLVDINESKLEETSFGSFSHIDTF